MNTTTESEKNASAEVPLPITKRRPASKTKFAKKAARAGKPASKPQSGPRQQESGSRRLIVHTKGATMAEIMAATGWQAHTVRGFVSILRKGGEKIESSKNSAGERKESGNSFRQVDC